MGLDIVDEPILIFAHAEKVVAFGNGIDISAAIRAFAIHQIFFGEKAFTADTVPAGVICFVDLIPVIEILHDLGNDFFVAFLGGADKVVIGNAQACPQLLKTHHRFIAVGKGGNAPFFRRLLNFLTMFIGSGKKEGRLGK